MEIGSYGTNASVAETHITVRGVTCHEDGSAQASSLPPAASHERTALIAVPRRVHAHPPFPAQSVSGNAYHASFGSLPSAVTPPFTPQSINIPVLGGVFTASSSSGSFASSVGTVLQNALNDTIVNDCLVAIFSYLPTVSSLRRVSATCRQWRRVATTNYFWHKPLQQLQESCALPPPGGKPMEELDFVAAQFSLCRKGVANAELTIPEMEEMGADIWGCERHAMFTEALRSFRYGEGSGAGLRRSRNFFCVAVISSWVDKFAVPFILVFFAVTFVFGTIPDDEEHGYQGLAVCVMSRDFRSTPSGGAVPPDLTASPSPDSNRSALGFDWLIQQLVLMPLVGWRLASWSRSASLVVAGASMRTVHVFLSVTPMMIILIKKLDDSIPYSVALVFLHVSVLIEWVCLIIASRNSHPDWHNPSFAPWAGLVTEESRERLSGVSVFKVAAAHGLIVLLLDVVLLVWTAHLDTHAMSAYGVLTPFYVFCGVACLLCLAFCITIVRSRFTCFTSVMGILTSVFVLLSFLAVPVPMEGPGFECG